MRQLVKIGFSCHTLAVHPGSRSYVHHVMMGRTFGYNTICPLSGIFKENLIFFLLFVYSPTLKANKGFLGSSNIDYNLNAEQQC